MLAEYVRRDLDENFSVGDTCLLCMMLESQTKFVVSWNKLEMSHVMRLWAFSSSVNSFFKRACAAIQWGLDI